MATVTLRPLTDAGPNTAVPSSGSNHYALVRDASESTNLYSNLVDTGEIFTFDQTSETGTINSVTLPCLDGTLRPGNKMLRY